MTVGSSLKQRSLKRLEGEGSLAPWLRYGISQNLVTAKVLKGSPESGSGLVSNRKTQSAAAASLGIEEPLLKRKAGWARSSACRWKRDERSYPEARGGNPELADGDQSSSRRPHAQESTDDHRDAVRVRRFTGTTQT